MRTGNPSKLLTIAAALLCIGSAHAEDDVGQPLGNAAANSAAATPVFVFSGFGTLGVAHSDNDLADFSSTVFHPNGTGRTRNWSADVDTKFGLQANAEFTDRLSGVLQLISQQAYDNSYFPTVEWANLSYKITPNLSVRAGRTVWPLLLRSETQNIGYGNPFVRNTTEALANMPNDFSDGVDVTYRFPIGAAENSIEALRGNSDVDYPGSGPMLGQNYLHNKDITGVSNVFEYGDLKVHAAYMKLKYDWLYFDFLLDAVPYSTWTAGFNYDPGEWFVTSDLLKAQDDSYGKFTAFMAGGGYRFGDWTPYALYSFLRQDKLGSLGSFGTNPGDQQTMKGVGVRWDFRKNMDFKLQYEQVRSGAISTIFPSSLTNWVLPDFYNDPRADVVSVVVDFVF